MKRKIKNALISVSDKTDLEKILLILKKNEVNIISSGGTYKKIVSLGFDCTEVSRFTKFKEMLDGRVKTLHPKIHAGILSNRSNKKHQNQMNKNKFKNILPFSKIFCCLINRSYLKSPEYNEFNSYSLSAPLNVNPLLNHVFDTPIKP